MIGLSRMELEVFGKWICHFHCLCINLQGSIGKGCNLLLNIQPKFHRNYLKNGQGSSLKCVDSQICLFLHNCGKSFLNKSTKIDKKNLVKIKEHKKLDCCFIPFEKGFHLIMTSFSPKLQHISFVQEMTKNIVKMQDQKNKNAALFLLRKKIST